LPWLVSLGAHLILLSAIGILLSAPVRAPLAPHVDITLVGAPGTGHGAIRTGTASSVGAFVPRKQSSETVASAPVPPESLPVPSAQDVLADVASASATAEATGAPSGTQLGWEGMPRRLIRKRTPEFPTVLSAMGQEIEGEARISVAPSGIVTRVEITRSSGYIEIDASMEAALRDYLFSRVDGRIETVGKVHFRYRLEKQD
jgi:outer membrane biosynthesis protein TonB